MISQNQKLFDTNEAIELVKKLNEQNPILCYHRIPHRDSIEGKITDKSYITVFDENDTFIGYYNND